MKPMLACDWDPAKVRFPVLAQPKIDGVRGINFAGALLGRSLKTHRNEYTTNFWTAPSVIGFDGELAAQHECHADLCRITSSALSTKAGNPFTLWWLFDYIKPETIALPYEERYQLLKARVHQLREEDPGRWDRVRVVPSFRCNSMEEVEELDTHWLEQGYEGTILRDPSAAYKSGRCTVREGYLLRIKRFIEEEARVLRIEEGETNLNEATINELGKTKRSTHQENMVANGMVGTLICRALRDVYDTTVTNGKLLFKQGEEFKVSPGCATHEERTAWLLDPHLIVEKVIKFKFFPKGIKDKPRFPQFVCIRSAEDQ